MIKVSIHQMDIIIVNIYAPNDRAPKVQLSELKREIDNSTIIVEDVNTTLSIMCRTT